MPKPKTRYGIPKPRYQTGKILVMRNAQGKLVNWRTCRYCHQAFMARVDGIKKGVGKFCSLSCVARRNNENRGPRTAEHQEKIVSRRRGVKLEPSPKWTAWLEKKRAKMITCVCGWCAKKFNKKSAGAGKFCSFRCAFAFKRDKHPILEKTCRSCSSRFHYRAMNKRGQGRLYCSTKCAQDFMRRERHPSWRGGTSKDFGKGWLKIAEAVRVRDGRICRRCSKTEAENGKRLIVDHVRPRRDFESMAEANEMSNLVSLCQSCHSKKTTGLERKWLRGDYLALQQYRREVGIL